jgi:CRP-like cAMP-binding protein
MVDPRRPSILSVEVELVNRYTTQRDKTATDKLLISESLKSHFVFNRLSEAAINAIINEMVYFELPNGIILFEQDSSAAFFFVLAVGNLDVIINGNRVKGIRPGEGFGELALLHDSPRSGTIIAAAMSGIWSLSRDVFRTVL